MDSNPRSPVKKNPLVATVLFGLPAFPFRERPRVRKPSPPAVQPEDPSLARRVSENNGPLSGKSVYIVDSHSLIYQVFHAMPEMTGPSGQPVTITGNALFGARFQNASTQNPNGTPSYTGGNDIKPTTPLIKEVKIVEDFERVLLWGVGLDHLVCPKVSELAGPLRVVLDFPTPP